MFPTTMPWPMTEPEKIVLYALGLYECTMNDPDPWGGYNQSSLGLLLNLPWTYLQGIPLNPSKLYLCGLLLLGPRK